MPPQPNVEEAAATEEGLVRGVRKMVMQTPLKVASPAKRPGQEGIKGQGAVSENAMRHEGRDKISGLDSCDGSSDASMAMQEDEQERLAGLQERLRAAKAKSGGQQERKSSMRSPGAQKYIAKLKKSRTVLNPVKIAQSFMAFQTEETLGGEDLGRDVEMRHAVSRDQMVAAAGNLMNEDAGNLVSAQGEPHQEK
jgi:hypothetical protein